MKRYTNGVDADELDARPTVFVRDRVAWTFVLVNDGNEPLSAVDLSDDRVARGRARSHRRRRRRRNKH